MQIDVQDVLDSYRSRLMAATEQAIMAEARAASLEKQLAALQPGVPGEAAPEEAAPQEAVLES